MHRECNENWQKKTWQIVIAVISQSFSTANVFYCRVRWYNFYIQCSHITIIISNHENVSHCNTEYNPMVSTAPLRYDTIISLTVNCTILVHYGKTTNPLPLSHYGPPVLTKSLPILTQSTRMPCSPTVQYK